MPVRFPCPRCSQPLDIVEKLDGKKVRCPECEHVFVFALPEPAVEERVTVEPIDEPPAATGVRPRAKPAASAAPQRSWGDRDQAASERGSGNTMVIVLMIAAVAFVLLLLGGGFMFLFMMRGMAFDHYDYRDVATTVAMKADNPADQLDFVDGPIGLNPEDLIEPRLGEALPIQPPRLEQERTEVFLGAPVNDVIVGGGGRFLILHQRDKSQLSILDVCQAKVVRRIDLERPDVKLAANLSQLIVATDREFQRFNLLSGERELVVPLPFQDRIQSLAMGHSSHGPLLVGLAGRPIPDRPGAILTGRLALVNTNSLRVIASEESLPAHGFGAVDMRATPDGRIWCLSSLEGGMHAERMTLALVGHEVRAFRNKRHQVNGWNGWNDELVYAGREATASQLHRGTQPFPAQPAAVPAGGGPFFLQLGPEGDPKLPQQVEGDAYEPVTVHRVGLPQPLATFKGLLAGVPREPGAKPEGLKIGRRLHYLPAAKVIVSLPGAGDRLLLQKFDEEEALRKLDSPPLYVAAEPPLPAPLGGLYRYRPDVRSSKGEVKIKLESGPNGMQLSRDGQLTWNVPLNLTAYTTPVVLSLREADGKEAFHSFHLHHPGNAAANDGSAPPEPSAARSILVPPPTLGEQPLTVQLSSPVASVTVGGSGRYLILTMPKERKVAVFDVTRAKVVKEIPTTEDHVLTAAGLNQLVVVLPRQRLLERWNLTTLEREAVAPLPPWNAIQRVAMGSSSQGPLLVQWATGFDELDQGRHDFLDIFTARPYRTQWNGRAPHVSFRDQYEIRASGDGRVFTLWATSHNPEGLNCLVRTGNSVSCQYQHMGCFHLIPSADGQMLFTGFERLNQTLAPLVDRGPGGGGFREKGPLLIPALQDGYYLSIEPDVEFLQPERGSSVSVHRADTGQRLFQVPGLDVGVQDERHHRSDSAYDRRLHFIPSAKVLIFMPTGNDRLVLHRVDVDAPPRR